MIATIDLLPKLMAGLVTTLEITTASAVVATSCALAAGLARLSHDPWLRFLSRTYVELFRGTSALVQLFWGFFVFPIATGIEFEPVTIAIIVLGLNIGAYGAEVVRAAIVAIPDGQWRAATALGLSRAQTLRHVILPQALLRALPAATNLFVELLKSTALVSLITVTDLTRAAIFIRDDTLRSVEVFGVVLIIYFALAMVITSTMRLLERTLSRGQDYGGAVR